MTFEEALRDRRNWGHVDGEAETCPSCGCYVRVRLIDHHIAWHLALAPLMADVAVASDEKPR